MRKTRAQSFSLAHYYQATWWGVLTLSTLLIYLSAQINAGILLVWFVTGLWIRRLLPWKVTRGIRAPIWFWSLVSMAVLVSGVMAFLGRGDWVGGLMAGLASMVPLFLYRRSKSFGNWMAFLVLSLLALISVVLKNSLSPYLLFIVYLTLVLFNLNATFLWDLAGAARSSVIALPSNFFRQFGSSLVAGGVLAIAIFLIFPRTRTLNNPFGWREQGVDVGYTGNISLKSDASLNSTSQLALIIDSQDKKWLSEEGSRIYYRGNVLDTFDGQSWTNFSKAHSEYRPEKDLRYWRKAKLPPLSLKVYREPSSVRSMIYPGLLLQVQANEKLLDGIYHDYNGILYRGNSERTRYSYDLLVAEPLMPDHWKDVALSRYASPSVKESAFVQIPEPSARLIDRWRENLPPLAKNANLDQVLAHLNGIFSSQFKTSLEHRYEGANALERFLLYEKVGHCEFFATAAALFLRRIGVPARVALGYRGGTYNPVSNVLEIRESSAHSWVEIYHPDYGWFNFDPTPTSPSPALSQLEAYWQFYSGAAKFWANRYIVNYNNATQTMLLGSALKRDSAQGQRSMFKLEKTGKLIFGILLGALFLVLLRKRWRSIQSSRLPLYYRRFMKQLRRQSLVRTPHETYGAFHRRAIQAGFDPDQVHAIDQALERDLYSRSAL